MNILGLDTSSQIAGTALIDNENNHWNVSWQSKNNHTTSLAQSVKSIFELSKTTVKDITAIAVSIGPGLFSSLRTGISFAKGFSFGVNIPIIGINSLEAEAFACSYDDTNLYPIIKVGRHRYAWSIFKSINNQITTIKKTEISSLEEIIANLTEKSIVCGENAIDLESFQKTGKINKNILIKQSYPANSRLFAITMLGKIKINNGEYSDPDTLTPNYSQEPSINKKKE